MPTAPRMDGDRTRTPSPDCAPVKWLGERFGEVDGEANSLPTPAWSRQGSGRGGVEHLQGEQFVAHAGAVGLDPGVLPGTRSKERYEVHVRPSSLTDAAESARNTRIANPSGWRNSPPSGHTRAPCRGEWHSGAAGELPRTRPPWYPASSTRPGRCRRSAGGSSRRLRLYLMPSVELARRALDVLVSQGPTSHPAGGLLVGG